MGKLHRSNNVFVPNESNTYCDRTGFKRKTSQVRKEWTGASVIDECFNERHPQDFPFIPTPEQTFEDAKAPEPDVDEVSSYTVI